MTTAQNCRNVNYNSPIQDLVHPDDQTQLTLEMTPGFKAFTVFLLFKIAQIDIVGYNSPHYNFAKSVAYILPIILNYRLLILSAITWL